MEDIDKYAVVTTGPEGHKRLTRLTDDDGKYKYRQGVLEMINKNSRNPLKKLITVALTICSFGILATMASYLPVEFSKFLTISPNSTAAPLTPQANRFARTRLGRISTIFTASVTTDKADYHPGEIVQVSGSGFMAGETVRLQVTHVGPVLGPLKGLLDMLAPHEGHDPWNVTADTNGNITGEWLVDEDALDQILLLTAIGVTSGRQAEVTFTDSGSATFRQCSNDNNTDGACNWINGILQANNSVYFEGMSTLQRLVYTNIVAVAPGNNTHVAEITHDSTKAGIHAYDFLTSYEQGIRLAEENQFPFINTESYTPLGDESGIIDTTLTDADACGPSPNQGSFLTNCVNLRNGLNRFDVPVPNDPFVSHDGLTQDKINAYEAVYGNRYIRIWANQPIIER